MEDLRLADGRFRNYHIRLIFLDTGLKHLHLLDQMNIVSHGVTNTGCTGLGGAALAHTGLPFVPSGPASSSFLL
jgi:hypothetical protein